MTGNTFYGVDLRLHPGPVPQQHLLVEPPTGVKVFIEPNLYEAGRANITVFNWNLSPT